MLFAQVVTVLVAVLFVLSTFKPEWVPLLKGGNKTSIYQTSQVSSIPVMPVVSFSEAASTALSSVVSINVKKKNPIPGLDSSLFKYFFGDGLEIPKDQAIQAAGSGVVINSDGLIVTNYHVIEGTDHIEVILGDNQRQVAELVGEDPETDIAILKIPVSGLKGIVFATPDSLKVGDVVLAIGNPFGVGETVTMGIVSALGRTDLGINTFENFIQTDAPINPGNSGGALVDSLGRLVGINTAIFSKNGGSTGIGFAVPISTIQQIVTDLTKFGKVSRGYLGVSTQVLSPEVRQALGFKDETGVLVMGVQKDGPAQLSDIRPGDILLTLNGNKVEKPKDLLGMIASIKPKEKVKIQLIRNGRLIERNVVLGQRPKGHAE